MGHLEFIWRKIPKTATKSPQMETLKDSISLQWAIYPFTLRNNRIVRTILQLLSYLTLHFKGCLAICPMISRCLQAWDPNYLLSVSLSVMLIRLVNPDGSSSNTKENKLENFNNQFYISGGCIMYAHEPRNTISWRFNSCYSKCWLQITEIKYC